MMGELKENPFDETAPVVQGFPLSTQSLVFLLDKGALTLSARLEPEIAGAATLEWSVEPANVVSLDAAGEHVTVTPAGAGQATITAKLTPKEGFVFDEASELVSECRVTVLEAFTLNTSKLLFFAGETATQEIEVDLSSQALAALRQVADIAWTQTGSGAALPADSSGVSIAAGAGSAGGSSQVDAQLVVKAGSEAAFNGNGTYAPAVTVKTFAVPSPVISGTAGSKMLSPGNAAAAFSLQMSYPAELDEFAPEALWTTSAANIAAVAGGTLSGGAANAVLTAKAQGTSTIAASLKAAGRSFPATPQTVSVVTYTPPAWDVQSIDITGAVSGGSLLTLTDTATSTLITATAKRSDANQPTNQNILWEVSTAGKVNIVPETGSNPTGGKIKITGAAETTSVTVTAKSESNPAVKASFTVKVNPITVSVTASPTGALVFDNDLTLNGTASLGAVKWSVTAGSDKVNLSTAEGASTKVKAKSIVTGDAAITVRALAKAKESYGANYTFTLKPHTYTVAFNPNGGAGTMSAQTVSYNAATALTANTFTRTGYTFDGWLDAAAGTTVVAADKAKASVLNENAEAKKPGGTATLYAKWKVITHTVTYEANGGTGSMAKENVNYGAAYTIKANGFSAPAADKVFQGWNMSGGGVKAPGEAITVTGNVTLSAQWFTLGEVVSGQESSKDLMIKFGVKPAGYTTATAADVTTAFLAAKAYINKPGVTTSNLTSANAKIGVIALRDYVKLPNLKVDGYNGGYGVKGDFNKNDVVVEVVGINTYTGKNSNAAGPHLVFQIEKIVGMRTVAGNYGTDVSNSGGYLATEVRRYLIPVASDAQSGNFLAGLLAAGVPEAALWAPTRVTGRPNPFTGSINTVTDLLFLPTVSEVCNGSVPSGSGRPITDGESSSNQGILYVYSSNSSRLKQTSSGSNEWWWLASAAGNQNCFGAVSSDGHIDFLNSGETCGIVPLFCLK